MPHPILRLTWSSRALRDSEQLDSKARKRIVRALERYAETRHGNVKKLADIKPPEYRLRVGPLRARFVWDQTGGVLTVLHVFQRSRGYK